MKTFLSATEDMLIYDIEQTRLKELDTSSIHNEKVNNTRLLTNRFIELLSTKNVYKKRVLKRVK